MKYGLIPQVKDERDYKLSLSLVSLPEKIDLRPTMPEVYDQGQLGSCTANAIGSVIQRFSPEFMPSRLFIYYNERLVEGTVNEDSGAQLRTGMKVINTFGACSEALWPYDISKFNKTPDGNCYKEATGHESLVYKSLTYSGIKNALYNNLPVIFGFQVQESFETIKNGVYKPKTKEQVIGGHAVVIVGYDDTKKVFIVRNSWGSSWGMDGYFTIPYTVVKNRGFDFWVIEKMKQ